MEILPNWLRDFVRLKYFKVPGCSICQKKCSRPFFCIDCCKGPLCKVEHNEKHKKHEVLQVCMASNEYSVRIVNIQSLVKIDDICHKSINQHPILQLKWKDRGKAAQSNQDVFSRITEDEAIIEDEAKEHICKWKGSPLKDPFRFCSIKCKVKFIMENPYDKLVTFVLPVGASNCSKKVHVSTVVKKQQTKRVKTVPGVPKLQVQGKKRLHEDVTTIVKKQQTKRVKTVPGVPKLQVRGKKRLHEDAQDQRCMPKAVHQAVIGKSTTNIISKEFSFRKRSKKGIPVRAPGVGISPGFDWYAISDGL